MEDSRLCINKGIPETGLEDMISSPQQIPSSLLTMIVAGRWITSLSFVPAKGASRFCSIMAITSYQYTMKVTLEMALAALISSAPWILRSRSTTTALVDKIILSCTAPALACSGSSKKNINSTFTPVYGQNEPGLGIAGYNVKSPRDLGYAF